MLVVFVITGILSSCLMLVSVKIFNPAKGLPLELAEPQSQDTGNLTERIVNAFTVNNFANLLNRQNILALIIFSILIGLASQAAGDKARPFREFLVAGSAVMGQLIKLIMLYAPIGLGAYFAYLVGVFGPQLIGTYAHAVGLYYPVAIFYFLFAFSFYAFTASGIKGIKLFWSNIAPATMINSSGDTVAAMMITRLIEKRKIQQ